MVPETARGKSNSSTLGRSFFYLSAFIFFVELQCAGTFLHSSGLDYFASFGTKDCENIVGA